MSRFHITGQNTDTDLEEPEVFTMTHQVAPLTDDCNPVEVNHRSRIRILRIFFIFKI